MRIVAQLGVGGVTFAKLAKSSGVSRSWLYKYVGNTREDLLAFAIGFSGACSRTEKTPDVQHSKVKWREDVVEGFDRLLALSEAYPAVVRLYFQFQGTGGHVGRSLDELHGRRVDRERLELMRIWGKSEKEARSSREALSVLRLSLAHGWVHGGLRKRASREQTRAMFERMFAGLVSS